MPSRLAIGEVPMTEFLFFLLELILCVAFFAAIILTVLLIGLITGTV